MLDNIFKNIERLLRWVYPGLLFFILLFIIDYNQFEIIANRLGFPEETSWGIILAIAGIGTVIYLFHQYILNTILVITLGNWWKNKRKDIQGRSRFVKHFNDKAKKIMYVCQSDKSTHYFYYNWGIYHALATTFWLLLSFFIVNILTNTSNWWVHLIWVVSLIVFLLGKLYLFLKLMLVDEDRINAFKP